MAQHLIADEPTPEQRGELVVLFGLAIKTSTLFGALIGGIVGGVAADSLKWNMWVAVIVGALAGMFVWAATAGGWSAGH